MPELALSNAALAAPPTSARITAYRPAVSFNNGGTLPANITGQLVIRDETTGREVFSAQLSCPTVAAGASGTAAADKTWTPTAGHTYTVSATLWGVHADQSTSLTLTPVTVATPGAAPEAPAQRHLVLRIYDADTGAQLTDPTTGEPLSYPFYLTFGRVVVP